MPSEARNVFLRTPEGLETPSFQVLHEGHGYEIREYDPYTGVWMLALFFSSASGCACNVPYLVGMSPSQTASPLLVSLSGS